MDHVAFEVSDLDAAIGFYTEKLGMKLRFRELDEAHGEAFAFLELGGADLELLQNLARKGEVRERVEAAAPYCPHVAIKTDDLDGLVERLGAEDIPIIKGPLEIPGKVKWLYAADLDGNILEFVEWVK